MIIEVRMDNCLVFSNPVSLSMHADMRNKRFGFNVNSISNFNILKSVAIFGQNNVGKTCAIKCIKSIKQVIMNEKPLYLISNFFSKSTICSLGITFLEGKRVYKFDFNYDVKKEEFLYEYFAEIIKDRNGNVKEIPYLKKDTINNDFCFLGNEESENLLSNIGRNNITIYLIDVDKFEVLRKIKDVLLKFASRIDIINMSHISLTKTLEVMKTGKDIQRKVVNFIKSADIDLDDFKYNRDILKKVGLDSDKEKLVNLNKMALRRKENLLDELCLISVHKGVDIPSLLIDSTGTRKIVSIASYVIDAIENGKVLIVDELDSSLHFTLTRAIVALFNNEINLNGQLIFTAHDVSLLDCKKLFRKEQIWFICRDIKKVYAYSLKEFTARETGVRDTSDLFELYKKGVFGALPEPNLIKSLLGKVK